MTIGHSYSNPAGRHIFRLRDFASRPEHGFNLERPTPDGYAKLTADEKMDVAEFVDFLISDRRAEPDAEKREHFYMRDDAARPATSQLAVPAEAPARYAELSVEERFHVHEFIAFLSMRRE